MKNVELRLKFGEKYYFIDAYGMVRMRYNKGVEKDKRLIGMFNCFQTRENAQHCAYVFRNELRLYNEPLI